MGLLKEIVEFLWAVINNWAGYATGGLVVALAWLYSVHKEKKLPRKWALALAGLFLLAAFFKAWQDQYRRAQSASVYVETHIEPAFIDSNGHPQFLPPELPIDAKFVWTRTGPDIANDVVALPKIYIEPDHSIKTQQRIVANLQQEFAKKLADNAAQQIKGTTLGYSDGSKSIWGTPQSKSPVLTKPLYSELWDGSKIVFYLSIVSYEDPSGQQYEADFCNYLQPLNLNDPVNKGKPLPENIAGIALSLPTCDMFNDSRRK